MCFSERNTTRRGRSAVPATLVPDAEVAAVAPVTPRLRGMNSAHYFAPVLPALRRTCSPWYRMPLPLYGSGWPHRRGSRRPPGPPFSLLGALDLHHRVVLDRDLDPLGGLVRHRVGIADDQVDPERLGSRPCSRRPGSRAPSGSPSVTPSTMLATSVRRQAVQRLVPLLLARARHRELRALDLVSRSLGVQRAARARPWVPSP